MDLHLLAALLDPATEADDGLRLAAADWYEENDQPERAEFVRVQLELARKMAGPAGPVSDESPWLQSDMRYHALRRRERELLGNVVALEWVLPLARALGISEAAGHHKGNRFRYIGTRQLACGESGSGIPLTWRRGFVHALTCTAADWLAHAGAILACQPVRRVVLTTWPEWEGVEARPTWWMVRLRGRTRLHKAALYANEQTAALLAAEWPAVTFTLPVTFDDVETITGQHVADAIAQFLPPA